MVQVAVSNPQPLNPSWLYQEGTNLVLLSLDVGIIIIIIIIIIKY